MRAAVAGDSNAKSLLKLLDSRAAEIASLIAKNTELPINKGGSPTAYNQCNIHISILSTQTYFVVKKSSIFYLR